MEEKYEKINTTKFPAEVELQFKKYTLPDNSIKLIRYKPDNGAEPSIRKTGRLYSGTLTYELKISPPKEEIEALVLVCRSSTNHYVVAGFSDKFAKVEYFKSAVDAGVFIKRWFCRSLLD